MNRKETWINETLNSLDGIQLIALNVIVAQQSHVTPQHPAETPATMASEYFSYLSPIKL